MSDQSFIDWMKKRNYDIKTIKTYNRCLSCFFVGLKKNWSYKDIDDFVSSLSLHPRTINNYLASIRLYVQYLSIQGLSSLDYRLIKFIKVSPTKVGFLTDECVGKIVGVIEEKNITDLRDRLIIQFLYESGLRVSELLSIKHQDIMQDLSVNVIGKGKKQRTVFLSHDVFFLMKKYKNEFEKISGRVSAYMIASHSPNNLGGKMTRVGIEKIVQKRAKNAGFDKVTPHTFRHTFATSLVRKGARIELIQSLLGHSYITTTQQYLHHVKNEIHEVQSLMFAKK